MNEVKMIKKIRKYAKVKGIQVNEILDLDVSEPNGTATLKTPDKTFTLLIEQKVGKVTISIVPEVESVMEVEDPLTGTIKTTSLPYETEDNDWDRMNDWAWENSVHKMEV